MSLNSCAVTPFARLASLFLCRGAGGRPALATPQDWRDRCTRVGLSCCPEKKVDSKDYVYFKYDCGCVGFKQISTLRRNGKTALTCPEHGGQRHLSQLLLRVRDVLRQACPDIGPIVLEAHLLPKARHPFDLWLPRWQIAAEVDGPQHFTGSYHGKSAAQQYKQDRQLDAKCKRRKLRLLRLHYAADRQWGSLLQRTINEVKENPHCWFLKKTGSYDYEAGQHPPTL